MLSVLLIWLDIFITIIPPGVIFLFCFTEEKNRSLIVLEDIAVFGLMIVTVYAQIFSLFGPVALAAHLCLYALDLVLMVLILKSAGIRSFIKGMFSGFSFGPVFYIIFFAMIILVMSFGSSRGYMHYDSDLYHAQAVRWIEEYGVVPGLGNIHGRLAYNSSSFALSALYSFSFLGKQSFHVCAGFLAMIVIADSFRILHIIRDKKPLLSDFARLASIYYVINIYDEMVSPASDYFAMLVFVYIVVRLLDVSRDHHADLWGCMTILAVFLATLKFSAAGMLVICVLPIILFIRDKKYLSVVKFATAGLVVSMPYFVRNYIISGWLLYPSTIIDIFDPAWKIPKFYADVDSAYIIAFGRGFSGMDAASMSFAEWFPHWFSILGGTEKLFMIASFVSVPLFISSLILDRKSRGVHLGFFSVLLSFVMWLFSSPLARYGQGIFLMLPFVAFGEAYIILSAALKNKTAIARFLNTFVIIFFVLFLVYKGFGLCRIIGGEWRGPYYADQLDYGQYDTYQYSVDGAIFYAPVSGDRTGYDPFPSTPEENHSFSLYGTDIRDGFLPK